MLNKNKFTEKNFASILLQYNYNLNLGDIIGGTIFHLESQGFLVDIGANIAGYLPHNETLMNSKVPVDCLKDYSQTTRDFFILAYQNNSQQILLSIKRLDYIRAWKRIKQIHAEDIILEVPIIDINKGGIITCIEGLQGFIPNSHLTQKTENYSKNKSIKCQLLIVDEKSNKLILSNKRAILALLKNELKMGLIVEGKIIAIKKYGVFVEINNIPALLHISEISYKHIDNIDKLFTVGSYTKVKIIHIDIKQGRISVSKKGIG